MIDDLRQGFRRLRRQPQFALAVVAVLALGIGAVTVVAAIARVVILMPLPYPDFDRLTVVWETEPSNRGVREVSYRDFVDWREQNRSFEELAVMGSVNWSHRLTGLGEPTDVPTAAVSASFFTMLSVQPQLGRVLLEKDDQRNAAPVAVIGFGFWQRHFGGDPHVIGRTITLDEQEFEIVGVMPRAFDFPRGAELWTAAVPEIDALKEEFDVDALEVRGFGILFAVGLLKPDVSLDQARKELDAINERIDRFAAARPPHAVVVTPLEERLLGRTRPALWLLLGAVALILVIGSANVSTMFLMRAASGQRETAVRLALGGSAGRLFRLWLAESVVLSVIATVSGLVGGWLALPFVVRVAPDSVYRIGEAQVTSGVVFATLSLALVGALVSSTLVSVLSTRRFPLLVGLRQSSHLTTARRLATARRALVTGELALSVLLLVFAGLTIRSFMNLRALDLGFDPRGVLTLDVSPSDRLKDRANLDFYSPLLEQLAALPDVQSVGAIYQRPLAYDGVGMDTPVLPEGFAPDDRAAWSTAGVFTNREVVTPGYFSAMRVPLRDGRYFTELDRETSEPVAILGESAARRLFPGQRALGRLVVSDLGPDGKPRWRTVVGIVADVRYRGLQDVRLDYYVPHRQRDDAVKHLVIRGRVDPLHLVAQIKQLVRQMDPTAVAEGLTTMDDIVDRAVAPWRLYMVLFAVLGGLALTMSSVGLYAVVRYSVVERWHELGIRTALGASARQITSLILRESVFLIVGGLIVGVALALALVRLMTTILFGVIPTDVATFLGVVSLLTILAVLAAYFPARRAGRADPAFLLRSS